VLIRTKELEHLHVSGIRGIAVARLRCQILDDLRVVMRVTGLAHLNLIHRLGRIDMSLHEVQQLRTITLDSLRGRKQGNPVIGNDYSFTSFTMFRYTAEPTTSAGQH
jgi:hypothetical protein